MARETKDQARITSLEEKVDVITERLGIDFDAIAAEKELAASKGADQEAAREEAAAAAAPEEDES